MAFKRCFRIILAPLRPGHVPLPVLHAGAGHPEPPGGGVGPAAPVVRNHRLPVRERLTIGLKSPLARNDVVRLVPRERERERRGRV